MSTIASIILMLLNLASMLLEYARNHQMIQAGADAEIAKASAAVLLKTESAKEIMAQVTSLNEEEVDKALKELEP